MTEMFSGFVMVIATKCTKNQIITRTAMDNRQQLSVSRMNSEKKITFL